MAMTPEQIKGRIRNKAMENNADARLILRMYMMERFLERVSLSEYKDNFILKGGVLVTSLLGIGNRSTMDIDTCLNGLSLTIDDCKNITEAIAGIDLDDGVTFEIKNVSEIMDEMEYSGVRVTLDAIMEHMVVPLKIDFSAGDIITPHEVEYAYNLLLENRSIRLLTYNLETILSEKLQTVVQRGVLNTRMRDFYDIIMLYNAYNDRLDKGLLAKAFVATSNKRGSTTAKPGIDDVILSIENDMHMKELWAAYQRKFTYAEKIDFLEIIRVIRELFKYVMLE